ncbi:MAG: hypothetical protein WCB46_03415 [Methanoregula sp.]
MGKKLILYRENVRVEPTSHLDPSGRIFYWNKRIFREIIDQNAWNVYTRLLESPLCPKLFDAGLIRTWIPDDVDLEGAVGILEHEKIDYIISPAEWTLTMLWDAATMVVNCLQILSQENYGFKDGHTRNVQFIHCSPKWIDFGSITENTGERIGCLNEVRIYFIVPLWLTKLTGKTGRKLSYELIRESCSTVSHTGRTIFSQGFLRFLPIRYFVKMKQFEKIGTGKKKSEAERFFMHLKTYVQTLKPDEIPGELVGHQVREGNHRDILKDDTVLTILKEINPESVIIFRAGDGFYSFESENSGYSVISAEFKETPLNTIYKRAQRENRRITPVKMDFLFPTPPCLMGLGFDSSYDRLRADVSLAVSFMHSTILGEHCSMELFTGIIGKYSKKASIIEFISPTDSVTGAGKRPGEYSRENLIHEMNNRGFSLKQEHVSGPGRHILVFVRD